MNYYEILKISKNATDKEIKESYKKLVKTYHPDLYVGDKEFAEKKIKEINEAYEILSDPKKKAEYDEYLNPPKEPISQPNAYYTKTYNTASNQNNYQQNNYQQNNNQTTYAWAISDFIFKKIDKLDKKRQLQLFISIVIFILALFLINLIQMKRYLSTQNINNSIIIEENNSNHNHKNLNSTINENQIDETNDNSNNYTNSSNNTATDRLEPNTTIIIPNYEMQYPSFEEFLNELLIEYYNDYGENPSQIEQ